MWRKTRLWPRKKNMKCKRNKHQNLSSRPLNNRRSKENLTPRHIKVCEILTYLNKRTIYSQNFVSHSNSIRPSKTLCFKIHFLIFDSSTIYANSVTYVTHTSLMFRRFMHCSKSSEIRKSSFSIHNRSFYLRFSSIMSSLVIFQLIYITQNR